MIWLSDCLCELRVKSFRISLNFVIFWNSESGQKTKNPKKNFGEAYDTMASIFLIAIWGGCLYPGSLQNDALLRGRWMKRVLPFKLPCWPLLSHPALRNQHKTRNHDCFRNFWCCLKLPKDKLEKKPQLNFFNCSFLFCISYFDKKSFKFPIWRQKKCLNAWS